MFPVPIDKCLLIIYSVPSTGFWRLEINKIWIPKLEELGERQTSR